MSEATYELVGVEEGKYRIVTEDEEIVLVVHPVLVNVLKKGDKLTFVVNNVVSVHTNTPKFGPPCSPNMVGSRPAKIKSVETLSEPKVRARVEGKVFEISVVVTNVSVFPEHRDPFGAPCVIVSTVVLH